MRVTVVFRRTAHNHYTLNALLGLLDDTLDPERFGVRVAGSFDELAARLEQGSAGGGPAAAAWSFGTRGFAEAAAEMAAVRARFPSVRLLAGGPHASALPRQVLAAGADAVFRGEAEESLPAWLLALAEGGGAAAGSVIEPLPLADFDRYPPFAPRLGLFGPIELTRGCPCRCAFCATPRLFPVRRERSVEYVLEHARRLRAAGKRRLFFIAPDALAYGMRGGRVNEGKLAALLEGVSSLDLLPHLGDFPSEVSPRTAARYPGVFRTLRRLAHNRRIVLGLQSGSERVLRLMGRSHSVEDGRAAVEAALEAGFQVLIDLLFGTPGEGREGREESLAFTRRYAADPRVSFHLHYLVPLPGTPLAGARPEPPEAEVLRALTGLVVEGRADGDFLAQMGGPPAQALPL